MSQNETLKIKANTDNVVEFMYDTPKTGTNSYGAWYLYGVRNDGKEVGIFATEALHKKLQYYKKGDKVNIRKEEYEAGKYAWNIMPEEGTNPKTESNTTLGLDDRTHDIHKQVCLKLAVDGMPKNGEMYTEAQLTVIEANMRHLLTILESTPDTHVNKEKEKLPF